MTTSRTSWTTTWLDPYGVPAEPRNGDGRHEPTLTGVYRARCGEEWEAIRVLAADGQRVLDQLGTNIGPVLASVYNGSWTFLIGMRPVQTWDLRGARLLRRGAVIELPLPGGLGGGRDVRWVVQPGRGETDPARLYQALSGTVPEPIPPGPKRKKQASKRGRKATGAPVSAPEDGRTGG
ncbi:MULTISPECIES: hypothetical protein [Streptomyces]|uniref:hypothetical protein n=1 Tax=Streptomyces TaxID=1883 RepID=UPI00345BF4A4